MPRGWLRTWTPDAAPRRFSCPTPEYPWALRHWELIIVISSDAIYLDALARARAVLDRFGSAPVAKTIWGSPAGKKKLAKRLSPRP